MLARRWLPLALLLLSGCSGGEDVNTRTLTKARELWESAKIRDYDLEWTTTGDREGHYVVFVRDGVVQRVQAFVEDRRARAIREIVAKPADPSYYGVEGLFRIIKEEHAECAQGDRPFGQPKGTKVLLRFTPDPKLGYPRNYSRDLVGSRKGLAFDVIRLDPSTAPLPPPPA